MSRVLSPIITPPSITATVAQRSLLCACGAQINAGDKAGWDRSTFVLRCLECVADAESAALDMLFYDVRPTTPAKNDKRLALANSRLTSCGNKLTLLPRRRMLRSREVIEQLIVSGNGVYVLQVISHPDAKVDTRNTGGLLAPAQLRLVVGATDQTSQVTALQRQAHAAQAALRASRDFADVPVTAVLCIIDAVFPWIGSIEIDGVLVRNLSASIRMVQADGEYDQSERNQIARALSKRLPPALAA